MKETFLQVGRVRVASLWSEAGELIACSMVCRECGCTEWNACDDGCAWAEIDLCTSCAPGVFMTAEQIEQFQELSQRFAEKGVLAI